MSTYSIKELEKLSGIKAHTIRIWEKRYKIVEPHRTTTNIRSYSDEDLKKIINVSLLNAHGLKISKIARLSAGEIIQRVSDLSQQSSEAGVSIDQLILAMVDLDEEQFDKILRNLVRQQGFEKAMTEIVYPFLEKIGVLWHTGKITPAQEHFISNLIRQKIIAAIDALPIPDKTKPGVVLFLPDEEMHELGLLFYHYVTRKSGLRTYYLGQMVPYGDLLSVCDTHRPSFLILSMTNPVNAQAAQEYLNRLCKDKPECMVFATGRLLKQMALKIPSNLRLFFNLGELLSLLKVQGQD